jgi:hypothetical protein
MVHQRARVIAVTGLAAVLTLAGGATLAPIPAGAAGPGAGGPAADPPTPRPVTHDELSRALEELAARLQALGGRWREHFLPGEAGGERPLISLMLHYRAELGLSPAQVDGLERLRAEFRREAIRREADLRVAEMDLGALRERDPVDLDRVEAKVREIERVRADLRLARIRAIEQGRALLSAEQRERLRALLGEPRMPARPLGPAPVPPPPPPPGGRL